MYCSFGFVVVLLTALPSAALHGQSSPKEPPIFQVIRPGEAVDHSGEIMFVTNRYAIAVNRQTPAQATGFLNTPTRDLKYGMAAFRMHGSRHDRTKLDDVVELGRRTRLASDLAVQDSNDPVLVYIHGYNNSFDDAVRQGVLLRHDLGIVMPLVVYSWASQGTPVGYRLDRLEIEENAAPLADYLIDLLDHYPNGGVNLVVHSMGNDVFLNAIELMNARQNLRDRLFGRVVMAAPDVSSTFFRRQTKSLVDQALKVVHYFANSDRAIFFSRFANPRQGPRAGARLVEVDGLEAINVDAVNDPRNRLGHSYFASSQEVLDDIRAVFGDELLSPIERSLIPGSAQSVQQLLSPSGFVYWRLLP